MKVAFATAFLVALGAGCGSSGGTGYALDVGENDAGSILLVAGDAAGGPSLDAYIEQGQVAVRVIALGCSGSCATVQAVGTGGVPPYTYRWENGTTSAVRQVCPASDASYTVKVTDTGESGEFPRPPGTAQASVTADVLACPDAGAPDAAGSVLAEVTVPATGDIWLAGQPDGAMLTYLNQVDVAPTDSPVEVSVVAGSTLTFSATGSTSFTGCCCYGGSPDGGCLVTIDSGPANGISAVDVPADALIGVFVGPEAPSGQAPPSLSFSGENTGFATLSPLVDQVFFIGDGLTGTGTGVVQQFVVPQGATRLFLASSDDLGASYNDTGTFQVTLSSL